MRYFRCYIDFYREFYSCDYYTHLRPSPLVGIRNFFDLFLISRSLIIRINRKMGASVAPVLVFTILWGAVGIALPCFVPNGTNRGYAIY